MRAENVVGGDSRMVAGEMVAIVSLGLCAEHARGMWRLRFPVAKRRLD